MNWIYWYPLSAAKALLAAWPAVVLSRFMVIPSPSLHFWLWETFGSLEHDSKAPERVVSCLLVYHILDGLKQHAILPLIRTLRRLADSGSTFLGEDDATLLEKFHVVGSLSHQFARSARLCMNRIKVGFTPYERRDAL